VFLILRPHVKELVNNTLVGNWELLKLSIEYQLLIINGVVVTAVKKHKLHTTNYQKAHFSPNLTFWLYRCARYLTPYGC
jgi:hypothetical protein